jgi:predicted esterase
MPTALRRIALCSLLGSTLSAQNAPSPSANPTITRADLAAAYLRLDQAMATATLPDTVRASVNRAFDRATLSFFGGRFAAAIATIDSTTVALTGRPIAAPPAPRSALVNGGAPSRTRAQLEARLARLDTAGPLRQAIVSAAARTSLLVDQPNPERSAEFLADPAALAVALSSEIDALEKGRDPYAKAAGDRWRAFRGATNTLIPFRIVATPAVATSARPVPLLVVFHGAGGDENMFIDAYGAGITAKLAAEQGMLLVSVSTNAFSASGANLDVMLAMLRSEYAIDSTRIYLLGHSMGSGAVARLVQDRPSVIAAAVCLAGGAAITAAGAPPVFFMAGELDPLANPRMVEAAAAKTAGSEYHLSKNEGHTLMVATGVRAGIPWLATHHR